MIVHQTPATANNNSIKAKAQQIRTLTFAYETPARVRPTTQVAVASVPPTG